MNFQNAPIQYQNQTLQKSLHLSPADHEFHFTDKTTEFDLLKIFRIIAKHYRLICIFLILGLVSGFAYYVLQPVQYRAQAKVEIGTYGTKLIEDIYASRPANDIRAFETARQRILTRDLARDVAVKLNLADNEQFTGSVGSRDNAVSVVQDHLSASILRNTHIMAISFTHADKSLAAEIANAVAHAFITQNVNRNVEASKTAHAFLINQVEVAKEKLQRSEQTMLHYAKAKGITITDDERSLVSKSIVDINAALSEAVRERLAAGRFAKQVEAGNAHALPAVFESPPIQITKQRIAELRATYQEKLSTLKPDFPEMKRLNAQILELEKQANLEINTIATAAKIRLDQAIANEAALKNELQRLEKHQANFREKNIQYSILKREVDSNRKQYENLISELNDTGVSAELNISNIFIIEQALPPAHPIAPNLPINLLTAFALSGALAAIFITLLELLDNRFSSAEQIEEELQIPVLGKIPPSIHINPEHEIDDMSSGISEAYRSLRTSLLFTAPDASIQTIALTSPGISDGKTTTCYKLALDFAALGKSVLVIDADLRKPGLHKVFDMPNRVGLSNLLGNVMDHQDIPKLFQPTDYSNVTILSAGAIPPNPPDLLASEKMAVTLHYAAKKYDLLILDCPPVLGLSDAQIISRHADATLLVVSQQTTLRKAASSAVTQLRTAGANLVGTVITRCTDLELANTYAYGYTSSMFSASSMDSDTYLLEGEAPQFDWEVHKAELTSPPYERTIL